MKHALEFEEYGLQPARKTPPNTEPGCPTSRLWDVGSNQAIKEQQPQRPPQNAASLKGHDFSRAAGCPTSRLWDVGSNQAAEEQQPQRPPQNAASLKGHDFSRAIRSKEPKRLQPPRDNSEDQTECAHSAQRVGIHRSGPEGYGLQPVRKSLKKKRALAPEGLIFLTLLLALLTTQAQAQTPKIILLNLNDTIQPISEEYVTRGLKEAEAQQANALLIQLNTPGGLLDTTRSMVSKILASPVPVIVYVGPSGSRAGSAGFFLLEAADIAAMAPGTNAGASHPVIDGRTLDPIMKQKLENDTTAFMRSFVSRRNRNVDAAQDAILNSKSYTVDEAQKLNLLDAIAPTIPALLNQIDGKTIHRFDGTALTLHTRNAVLIHLDPTTREQLLDKLMDPNLAVLILILGGLLIYLEFNVPGTIIPGAVGTLLLVTALFALNLLPIHYAAVMLLLASFLLMILEAKFPSHGIVAAAGIVALIFGTLTLVDGPIPELRVALLTAIACGLAFGLITVFLVRIAMQARKNKVVTGVEALIGTLGIAQEPLAPRGQILVHGELWAAESPETIPAGDMVKVRAIRGLTLVVEKVPPITGPAN